MINSRTQLAAVALALLAAAGCKKEEKNDGAKDDTAQTDKAADAAAAPDTPPEPKMVEMELPKTGLAITLPEGASVDAAIIEGADQVTFPGVTSKMVVKPRLVTDKELDAHIEWAKGHQIQKFQKEILKEGSGKTYTYIHAVDMGGQPKVVYMQMFQVGDKDFACFANADDEKAAMAMKAACATIKPGAGAAAADDTAADEPAADDAPATAKKKAAPKKKPAKKKPAGDDEGGW